MSPRNQEEAPAVGQQVREFAQLHVDLARTEVRDGSTRFFWGLFVLGASISIGTVSIGVFAWALYLLLRAFMPPTPAASFVAVALGALSAIGLRLGWRLVGSLRSLLLPQTRAMLGELFTWRSDKTSS